MAISHFNIYRYISFVKNFLQLSKAAMYTIEVPSRREHIFLDKLQKACYIQLKKRRTVKELVLSEYVDEIYFTINVFLQIIYFNLIVLKFVLVYSLSETKI